MPHKARAINKKTQNPQALWKGRFEALWNLGILKGSETGGVPVAHLRKPDWGELQGLRWKYYTGCALSRPEEEGGLPGKLHRSISIRHRLVWGVFPSISAPVRANPAQPWLLWKEGQCPDTGGEVGSQRISRNNSATFYLCIDFSVKRPMQPSRENTPNEPAAFLLLPQISLGLSGKGGVRSNSVTVSFHQKQQR